MSIQLEVLRELTSQELDRWSLKYPKTSDGLQALKKCALSRLEGETIEYESLGAVLDGIVHDADALENQLGDAAAGYVFASSQSLTAKLEDWVKNSLSKGVVTFPELKVELSLASKEKPLDQDKPDTGSRTKLGGSPDWMQNNATPICAHCKRAMTFVAQIDSIALAENGLGRTLKDRGIYMFADAGMIYVFWCGTCNSTQSLLQCG